LMAIWHLKDGQAQSGGGTNVSRCGATTSKVYLVIWFALFGCNQVQPSLQEPPAIEEAVQDWSAFHINDVFPEGAGRDLVLDNCQSCHVLVPILVLPLDEAAWYRSSLEHRERVEGLTDDEFETLYQYLESNFTPDKPTPELPPALLDSWTTY